VNAFFRAPSPGFLDQARLRPRKKGEKTDAGQDQKQSAHPAVVSFG
jgi:hypothetical protein